MTFFHPDNFFPDCSVGYLIRRCHQLGQGRLEPVFSAAGLTGIQWSALIAILVGRACNSAELAREISYDKGATTRLVDVLEAQQWVTRTRDAGDRRVVNLLLTTAGEELALRVRLKVIATWNEWLQGWDPHEIESLIAQLQRLRDTIDAKPRGASA